MTDFETKRRNRRTASAVLTENEVRLIKRALLRKESTPREIAQIYCVGVETIRKISRGDSWGWVIDAPGVEEREDAMMSTPMSAGMRDAAQESLQKLLNMGIPITQGEDRLQAEMAKVMPKIKLAEDAERALKELAGEPPEDEGGLIE